MRSGTAAILFVICLNVATMILSGMNISPLPGWSQTMNLTQSQTELEASINGMMGQGAVEQFFFIGGILLKMVWQVVSGTVFAFPSLLASFGVPTAISAPIYVLWIIMFVFWLYYVFSGREF
jgi:hypothetical protein